MATYRKQCLPNYTVFDEERYFTPGSKPCVVDIDGVRLRHRDLRGHLVSGPRRGRPRGRCEARDRSERLALPHATAGGAPARGVGARARERPSGRVRQSGRRAGRARLRRRLVRGRRRRRGRPAIPGVARDRRHRRISRRRGEAGARHARSARRGARVRRARHGRARLRRQEPLPGRAARPLRRRRLGADARDRGRRARARPRPRRHAAVAIHARHQRRGRARDGGPPRRALRRVSDRTDGRRLRRQRWRTNFAASPPMRPRRTSRHGFAARC